MKKYANLVKKAINDPKAAKRRVKKTVKSYHPNVLRRELYAMSIQDKTSSVMNKDWDTLIILDGCRYDAFKNNHIFNGHLRSQFSPASSSSEFMKSNFSNKRSAHNDTIIVTANKYNKLNRNSFFRFIDNDDKFDPELGTIPPEPVIKRAEEISKKFQNKRLILWLMQPHVPFINQNGKIINSGGWSSAPERFDIEYIPPEPKVWSLIRNEKIAEKDAWNAYIESLIYVQEALIPFLSELQGKTVITADHGTAFGERPFFMTTKEYGGGMPGPETRKVPWFVLSSEN